jgi:hypothetical protein
MTFGFNTGALATMPAERRAHVYVECRYGADQDALGPWLHRCTR